MIESDLTLGILSTTEQAENAKLTLGYWPCSHEGVEFDEDTTPEEFLIEEPEELFEKELFFKVKITGAENLPVNLCKNAFVTYAFKFDPTPYKTDDAVGKKISPKWNYEK